MFQASPHTDEKGGMAIKKLPSQSKDQLRGIQAADVVSLALSRFSFVHRVETGTDIGVDFICERREGEHPTGRFFFVQAKVLPKSAARAAQRRTIAIGVKVKTARYWLSQASPTVLCVADPINGDVYWSLPAERLSSRDDSWRDRNSVRISVSRSTRFSCFDSPPPELLQATDNSASQLGVALRERQYDVERIMREEAKRGLPAYAKRVATDFAAENSALRESLALLRVLDQFNGNTIELVLSRVEKYYHSVYAYGQKVFGRYLRSQNVDDWDERVLTHNFGAGSLCDVSAQAKSAIDRIATDRSDLAVKQILDALEVLESLHEKIVDFEDLCLDY